MHKEQVHKFYEILWDAHDQDAIPAVLKENFTFRGSLGQEKRGHAGFAEYVDMVHKALGEYKCIIEELVAEGNKVFVKMTFTGIHRDEFMGYPPHSKPCELEWMRFIYVRWGADKRCMGARRLEESGRTT